MNNFIIYLTGSTGFLGNQLLRDMSVSLDITKIYCPIRNKNSKTGTERFNLLCNDLNADGFITNKLIFIDPNELLPTDVNNVILCAFSISFNQTIKDMVNDNITPIINILKQCKSTIKVTFISTAYTQPPKPYVLNKNLFSMELSGNSYIEHYNSLINNSCNWNMIKNYEQPKHFTHNTYIYTKVLTENICNYYCNKNNINLNIIRPSQIVVSSLNSKHGSSTATMAGVRAICCKLIRVFNYSDNINAVPVDKVSSNIIQSLKNNKKINIEYATSNNNTITTKELINCLIPTTYTICVNKNGWLYVILKKMERYIYRLLVFFRILSSKKYNMIVSFYKDYMYFTDNTWDFENVIKVNKELLLKNIKMYAIYKKWLNN